eukprot:3609073-Prymnesium_polylepis.1
MLLAWTLADARGATAPLEPTVAKTAGKRLDRQVSQVRANLLAISDDERRNAHAAVATATGVELEIQTLKIKDRERMR